MARSEVGLPSVMLGLAAMLKDPRAEPELIGDVAEHAWKQLGQRNADRLREALEGVSARVREGAIDPAEATLARARLARLISCRVDGIALLLLGWSSSDARVTSPRSPWPARA